MNTGLNIFKKPVYVRYFLNYLFLFRHSLRSHDKVEEGTVAKSAQQIVCSLKLSH